jgi:hypothetical protein
MGSAEQQSGRPGQVRRPVLQNRLQIALKSSCGDDDVTRADIAAALATEIADSDTGDAAVADDQILRHGCPLKSDVRVPEARAIDRFDEPQSLASCQMKPGDGIAGRPCQVVERDTHPGEPVIEPLL